MQLVAQTIQKQPNPVTQDLGTNETSAYEYSANISRKEPNQRSQLLLFYLKKVFCLKGSGN